MPDLKITEKEVVRMVVKEIDTGRRPFTKDNVLVLVTKDEDGKEQEWTARDSEGRAIRLAPWDQKELEEGGRL